MKQINKVLFQIAIILQISFCFQLHQLDQSLFKSPQIVSSLVKTNEIPQLTIQHMDELIHEELTSQVTQIMIQIKKEQDQQEQDMVNKLKNAIQIQEQKENELVQQTQQIQQATLPKIDYKARFKQIDTQHNTFKFKELENFESNNQTNSTYDSILLEKEKNFIVKSLRESQSAKKIEQSDDKKNLQRQFINKLNDMIYNGSNSTVIKDFTPTCSSFRTKFDMNFNQQYDIVKINNAVFEFNRDDNQENVIKYKEFPVSLRQVPQINKKDLFPQFTSLMIKSQYTCSNGIFSALFNLMDDDEGSSYGMVFRYQNFQNYLLFEINSSKQTVSVKRVLDGNISYLYQKTLTTDQYIIKDRYEYVEIRFNEQQIMIEYKGLLNIKIEEHFLLTGNVGIFVNKVTELFIKEVQVQSLIYNSNKKPESSKKTPKQQDAQPIKQQNLSQPQKKGIFDDDIVEYEIDLCYKKAVSEHGCNNYNDNSCYKITCNRCCHRFAGVEDKKCINKCTDSLLHRF